MNISTVYRIRVRGMLDEDLSERLGGMAITNKQGATQAWVATLEGPLRDQAALAGVLNTLYEMHCWVLNVAQVDEDEE